METTVLVALVGAGGVVAGAGLTVLGGYLSMRTNRETVNRQIEADAAERDRERRFMVAENDRQAHRDERRSAHEEALLRLRALRLQLMHEGFQRSLGREPSHPRTDEFEAAVRAVSRVSFVATEQVREACNAAMAPLYEIDAQNDMLHSPRTDREEYWARVRESDALFETNFGLYEDAARAELGLRG